MIGGNDRTLSSESKMTGNLSIPSNKPAYSIPFGCFSRISERDISSSIARGINRVFGEHALTLNGGLIVSKS